MTNNAASVTTRGVEADAEWAPAAMPGFVFKGSAAYSDAKYDKFPNAPCFGGQSIAEGCTIVGITPMQDLSGKSTPLAPKWTGSFDVNYESSPFNGLVFGASANVRFSDEYLLSPFGSPSHMQDSYVGLDANLRLRTEDKRWELALIGRNLTDEYILNGAGDAPSSGAGTGTAVSVHSDAIGTFNPPRTLMLQVSRTF